MKSFMLDPTEMSFINKMMPKSFLVMLETQAMKKITPNPTLPIPNLQKATIHPISKIVAEIPSKDKQQTTVNHNLKQKHKPEPPKQEPTAPVKQAASSDTKAQKFRPTAQKKQNSKVEPSKSPPPISPPPNRPAPGKKSNTAQAAPSAATIRQGSHPVKSPPPAVGNGTVSRENSSQLRETSNRSHHSGHSGGNAAHRVGNHTSAGVSGRATAQPHNGQMTSGTGGNEQKPNPESQGSTNQLKGLSLVELAGLIKQLPKKYLPGLWNVLTSFRPELQEQTQITFDLAECHPDLLVKISQFVQDQLALEESLKKRLRKEPETGGRKNIQAQEVTAEELHMMEKSPEKCLLGHNNLQIMSDDAIDARALKASAKTGLRSLSSGSDPDDLEALENSDSSSSTSGNTPSKEKLKYKQKKNGKPVKPRAKIVDSLTPSPILTTIPARKRQEIAAKVQELDEMSRKSQPKTPIVAQTLVSEPKIKYIPDSEEPVSLKAISNSQETGSRASAIMAPAPEPTKPSDITDEPQSETMDPPPVLPATELRPRSPSPINSNDSSSFISTSI